MRALTSSFLFDVESRWENILVDDYAALAAAENMWWNNVTKVIPSGSRSHWYTWVLQTAMLEGLGRLGGNLDFPDMVMLEQQFTPEFVGSGLRLLRSQFEDSDGNGIELGTSWMRQIAAQKAYWPQKQVANLLKNGHLNTGLVAYDGLAYFHATHPLNPKNASAGTYGNLIPSVPIDASVAADVALANLAKVFAHIGAIKMPNGNDPRFLQPVGIFAGPTLFPRVAQLTQAKFIASVAGASGDVGGTSDVEAMVSALGYGRPVKVPELAGFETDTTYFVVASAPGVPDDQLAGFVHVEREPVNVRFYTGQGGGDGVDAILGRSNQLEWQASGRTITAYGHPYRIFKCTAGA